MPSSWRAVRLGEQQHGRRAEIRRQRDRLGLGIFGCVARQAFWSVDQLNAMPASSSTVTPIPMRRIMVWVPSR
jgi:hypothetical protein